MQWSWTTPSGTFGRGLGGQIATAKHASLLAIMVCALIILAIRQSLWWFAAASAAAVLGLRFWRTGLRQSPTASSELHYALLGTGTVLSLLIYGVLASVILMTVRVALGWLDLPTVPFAELPLPAYMQKSSLGYYDKSELRLVLLQFVFLTIAFGFLFLEALAHLAHRGGRPILLHPATAAFGLILYFSSVSLPPYSLNLDHWFPYVAAATGIRNGVWPYMSGFDPGYGILAPAFIAAWLWFFGLSVLSLSAVVMLSNLITGAATFALIRRLTGSRAVALLAASYLSLGFSSSIAINSTFRSPLQTGLSGLLLYLTLRGGNSYSLLGFLFGVIVLWDPTFGVFAAAGFLLAHGYSGINGVPHKRAYHVQSIMWMFIGVAFPLIGLLILNPSMLATPSRLSDSFGSAGGLFLLGYANLAQQFDPLIVAGCIALLLYVSIVLRRFFHSRKLTCRSLFVGASLISAVPHVAYATSRSDAPHFIPIYWALIPSVTLLFYGGIRFLGLRSSRPNPDQRAVPTPIRLSTTVLSVAFIGLFPFYRLNDVVADYTTRYEPWRQRWFGLCAAGLGCDEANKPSLRNFFRYSYLPLEKGGTLKVDPHLIAACRGGWPIISYQDAWIYAAGRCYAPSGIPSVNMINTRNELNRYIEAMSRYESILFDAEKNTYAGWKGDMLGEIKGRLLQRGYAEFAACGQLSILTKGAAASLVPKICG